MTMLLKVKEIASELIYKWPALIVAIAAFLFGFSYLSIPGKELHFEPLKRAVSCIAREGHPCLIGYKFTIGNTGKNDIDEVNLYFASDVVDAAVGGAKVRNFCLKPFCAEAC